MIKRLHFLPWSLYFTERIAKKIESYSPDDQFVVWKPQTKILNAHSIYSYRKLKQFVNQNCDSNTRFISHSLLVPVAILLGLTKWRNNFSSWITWGAEYDSLKNRESIFKPIDLKSPEYYADRIIAKLKNYLKLKAINQFDRVFSTIGELDILNKIVSTKTECISYYSYFNFEELIQSADSKKDDILLIGNSNDVSNRHIEALSWINKNNYLGKVLIPLPDSKASYILEVAAYLVNKKQQATILSKNLAPCKFQAQLSKCTYAVMYHQRQQGMLTLYILFWHGVKIFLLPENPLAILFTQWNLHFRVINKDLNRNCWIPLTPKQRIHNRLTIEKYLSEEIIATQYQSILI